MGAPSCQDHGDLRNADGVIILEYVTVFFAKIGLRLVVVYLPLGIKSLNTGESDTVISWLGAAHAKFAKKGEVFLLAGDFNTHPDIIADATAWEQSGVIGSRVCFHRCLFLFTTCSITSTTTRGIYIEAIPSRL